MIELRRVGSSSMGVSSDALLPGRATNAGTMGTSVDDVPPCPPWVEWCGPWAPLLMHFHTGWSGPVGDFDHGDYRT
jgi:hypothetical protein